MQIAQTLKHLLPYLGNSEPEYDRIIEVVSKAIGSINRKSDFTVFGFQLALPFLVFLCEAVEKIRYEADTGLSATDI